MTSLTFPLHILGQRFAALREALTPRSAGLQLAVLIGTAGLSSLIYWLAFAGRFNLLELYDQPLLDLYHLSQRDPTTRWSLLAAFLALGILYWLGWRAAQRAQGTAAWVIVLAGAVAMGAPLIFLYPLGAADVFDNILHGRILGVYGGNPFYDVARQFADDPFYPYVAWRSAPSAYGPAWEALAALTARLAGDGIVANVLAFKLLSGLFLAAGVGTVALILRRWSPERALAGVLLLAWNPIILYETLGNGHNDTAMAFWILAAAWALSQGRYTLAILALVSGTLFKFIPVLLLPAAGLIALRELADNRARLRFLLVTAVAALLLVLLAYAPFWRGLDVLGIARRARLLTTSLPAFAWAISQPHLGNELAATIVSRLAAAFTLLFSLWQGRRAWQDRTRLSFSRAALNVLIFYLLVTCLWFQEWYTIWPLMIAPLLPPGHGPRLAVILGYAGLTKPLLFVPTFLWIEPLPPKVWRELWLGPAVMLIAWLYALLAAIFPETVVRARISGNEGLAVEVSGKINRK